MSIRNILLTVLSALISSGAGRADDRYYMMIFGSETDPFAVRFTHTFALFVKASGEGNDGKLEAQTLSWMPRSLSIRVLARRPEQGANLGIAESIQWADSVGGFTTMWGPFEVRKEFYDLAARQAARLNAGGMLYVCNDKRFRGEGASNCIHAVSDLDTTQPFLTTGTQCGNAGSELVLEHFARHILPQRASHRWLVERLGLDKMNVRFATPEALSPARESAAVPAPAPATPEIVPSARVVTD
jgi:hypothetical protein